MEEAKQKEASFKYGAGLDESLPTGQAISTLQDLEERLETQLSTIPDDDPDYQQKI